MFFHSFSLALTQKFTYVTSAMQLGWNPTAPSSFLSALVVLSLVLAPEAFYTVLTLEEEEKKGLRVMLNVFGMSDFKTGHIARV